MHIICYTCYIYQIRSVFQLCPTLCDPMNRSMPGLLVLWKDMETVTPQQQWTHLPHWELTYTQKSLSRVWLFATPWIVAHQAPRSMGFSRHEYWSRLLFLLQGIFLTQGLNPGLPHCRQTLYHLSYQGSPSKTQKRSSKFQKDVSWDLT